MTTQNQSDLSPTPAEAAKASGSELRSGDGLGGSAPTGPHEVNLLRFMVQQLTDVLAAAGAPDFENAGHAAAWAASTRQNAARLEWARRNCRVIYYPPDNAYPIEHAPHAGKDMWEALAVAADTSSPNAEISHDQNGG